MKDQLKTIREALHHGIRAINHLGGAREAMPLHDALPVLTQLEAMVGEQEPKFWYRPVGDDGLYEGPVHHNSVGGKMLRDEKPGEWVPLFVGATPPAQQPQYEAGDMASAHNDGFRAGVASVAQQPQARPDFNDEWTGYLKDGETPFERLMRERKDLGALTKLYQRALEENERLKAQQPRAELLRSLEDLLESAEWLTAGCDEESLSDDVCRAMQRARATIAKTTVNPATQQAEAVPAWTTEQITAVAQPIALEIAENCKTAPQLVFPHLFLGLKDLLTAASPQQAEAVPGDVVRDADVEAAAKKMAEIFDYPWDFMPEKGRNTMRENVRAVLAAAQGEKP